MKMLIVTCFFLITWNLQSQTDAILTTFCRGTDLTKQCYRLHQNGRFIYEFQYCGGGGYGTGTYTKVRDNYILTFSSVSPEIKKQKEQSRNKNLRILCRDTIIHKPVDMIRIEYKGQTFYTDAKGEVELDYSGGEVALCHFLEKENIIIHPDLDDSNRYIITWDYYAKKYNAVVKMRKRLGNKYKSKEVWIRKDEKGKVIEDKFSQVFKGWQAAIWF